MLKVESTVCFQCKRGLPSSIKTKAGQVCVVVHCEFGCVLCACVCGINCARLHSFCRFFRLRTSARAFCLHSRKVFAGLRCANDRFFT
ncbi:hypothetical protein CG401_06275 [Bifidobacteriaceae bacterium NR019]|nr:hypothetical protein CG401_06275 [Bifidobacteriaceae bacterium NR019]